MLEGFALHSAPAFWNKKKTCKHFLLSLLIQKCVLAPPALPLQHVRHHNKDKSRFAEGAFITKFYSEGSIFLKESIDDVNEVWRERNEHSEIRACGKESHGSDQFYFPRIHMLPVNLTHHTISFEKKRLQTEIFFSFQIISRV